MFAKWLVIVVGVLALLLILWLIDNRESQGGTDTRAPNAVGMEAGEPQEPRNSELGKHIGTVPFTGSKQTKPPENSGGQVEAPEDTTQNRIHVKGQVRYFEGGDDVERFSATVRGYEPKGVQDFTIAGRNGSFEGHVPLAGRYWVRNVQVDGLRGRIVGSSLVYLNSTERVTIKVQALRDITLVVIDAVAGTPLPSARAYYNTAGMVADFDHAIPNEETLVSKYMLADANGRIMVRVNVWRSAGICVVAEGYAWSNVGILADGSVEQTVGLVPGGSARLKVQEWSELEDAHVSAQLTERDVVMALPQPDESGTALIKGLLPGDYVFRVHRGNWYQGGVTYGKASGTVSAGTTTNITIPTTSEASRAKVVVSGEVIVPKGWGKKGMWASFKGIDAKNRHLYEIATFAERASYPPCKYSFKTKPLLPGRYAVSIEPYSYNAVVRVATHESNLVFRLPPPSLLRLRVVDPSGADVEGASVTWYLLSKDARGVGGSGKTAKRNPRDGFFEIQAPMGTVQLSVEAEGYSSVRQQVAVQESEERSRTIQLGMSREIRVVVRWSGARGPTRSWLWGIKCEQIDGEKGERGTRAKTGSGVSAFKMFVSWKGVPPARYRISFPEIKEFKSVLPRDVVVGEVGLKVIEVKLDPRQ